MKKIFKSLLLILMVIPIIANASSSSDLANRIVEALPQGNSISITDMKLLPASICRC